MTCKPIKPISLPIFDPEATYSPSGLTSSLELFRKCETDTTWSATERVVLALV